MVASLAALSYWTWRRWLAAAVMAIAVSVAIGVPTGLIETPFYTRMTSVRWWDYPLWVASSALTGLVLATYVRWEPVRRRDRSGRTLAAALGSVFAVGCPVCNKLVVAVLGFSGALEYFAPIQPVLGVASVVLLACVLLLRLRDDVQCELLIASRART